MQLLTRSGPWISLSSSSKEKKEVDFFFCFCFGWPKMSRSLVYASLFSLLILLASSPSSCSDAKSRLRRVAVEGGCSKICLSLLMGNDDFLGPGFGRHCNKEKPLHVRDDSCCVASSSAK